MTARLNISGRRNKYGAVPTVVDGIRFASKREARRYGELKTAEKMGLIRNLELQPKFEIVVKGQKICTYRGDFLYFEDGVRVVEDSKGHRTQVYKLKKKLMKALYNIEILET